jgi:hypothetical protein
MDPSQKDIVIAMFAAAASICGILVGMIGILYAVYAQFAMPDENGESPPVIGPLKTLARATAAVLALSVILTLVSLAWLLRPNDLTYYTSLVILVADMALLLLISAKVVFKLFI